MNVIPIEIKSGKDYYRHNAMNNVIECEEYNIDTSFVFCNGNIETKGKVVYLPIYMITFLNNNDFLDQMIFDSDFTDINNLI